MTPTTAAGLTERQANELLMAYLERKKFEARILWSALGEALNEKDDRPASLAQLAALGFGIRGA